jgi:Fe2+ transport system protein B
VAEDFFKKMQDDWKKGMDKFKANMDKTFKKKDPIADSDKNGKSDTDLGQNESSSSQAMVATSEQKVSLKSQWEENWKKTTDTARQTMLKWQADWQAQIEKIQEQNRENRAKFKAKTEALNQSVKNFFAKQQEQFEAKVQEINQKIQQNQADQKESTEQMAAEWNAFIEDSKNTFKQLQKSQDRVFWKTTGYWLLIALILMVVVFGVMTLLRYLGIWPVGGPTGGTTA